MRLKLYEKEYLWWIEAENKYLNSLNDLINFT